MTLIAYFMSKAVFDVQGCRALTLTLSIGSLVEITYQKVVKSHIELLKLKIWLDYDANIITKKCRVC